MINAQPSKSEVKFDLMELLEQDDGGACDKLAGRVQGCAYLARGGGRRTPAGRADRWRTAAEVGADPACGTQTGREGELLFERARPLLAVMYAKKGSDDVIWSQSLLWGVCSPWYPLSGRLTKRAVISLLTRI